MVGRKSREVSRRSVTKQAKRRSCARVAAVLAIVSGAACGTQPVSSPDYGCGGAAPGLQAPPCTCTSWTNYVIPTSDYLAGGGGGMPALWEAQESRAAGVMIRDALVDAMRSFGARGDAAGLGSVPVPDLGRIR